MNIGRDRRMVYYPCANYSLMNFLLIHPSNESRSEGAGKCAFEKAVEHITDLDIYRLEPKRRQEEVPRDGFILSTGLQGYSRKSTRRLTQGLDFVGSQSPSRLGQWQHGFAWVCLSLPLFDHH